MYEDIDGRTLGSGESCDQLDNGLSFHVLDMEVSRPGTSDRRYLVSVVQRPP